jgi:hypothetical protein
MGYGTCHSHVDGRFDCHLRKSPWDLPLSRNFSTRIADAREKAFAKASPWPGVVVHEVSVLLVWRHRDRTSSLSVDDTAHKPPFCEEELL